MIAKGGVFVGLAGVLAAGCGSGGSGGVVSCTLGSNAGDGFVPALCQEVPAIERTQVQQSCMLGATSQFTNGPCSHVGALGGCRQTTGPVTETIWYYDDGSGQTSADIQMLCDGIATFVPP
jgi:hypothetical protein